MIRLRSAIAMMRRNNRDRLRPRGKKRCPINAPTNPALGRTTTDAQFGLLTADPIVPEPLQSQAMVGAVSKVTEAAEQLRSPDRAAATGRNGGGPPFE